MAETTLNVTDLVMPLFVKDIDGQEPIASMPGIFKFGPAALLAEVESCVALGIKSFIAKFGLDSGPLSLGLYLVVLVVICYRFCPCQSI